MKEDYPERIFLSHNPNGEIGDTWHARPAELDEAEYIRADLVEDLVGHEFGRGFEEGQRFAWEDDWHKWPEEKAKPLKDYLVTALKDDGTSIASLPLMSRICECSWRSFGKKINVIAWKELLEPFEA